MMAVSRKPVRPTSLNSLSQNLEKDQSTTIKSHPLPGVNVDAIISRGGSVALDVNIPPKSRKSVLINLPHATVEAISNALAKRTVKITRQTWIEEAIAEKLALEK